MAVLTHIIYWRKFTINGRENKFMTAIIIMCRPILTSRSRLMTYKRLVSVSGAEGLGLGL